MWNSGKWIFVMSLVLLHIITNACGALTFPKKDWDELKAKDNGTLLNTEFLPFLQECNVEQSEPSKIQLCSLYYDMVYNALNYGKSADVRKEIITANYTLEKNDVSEGFCDTFPNETSALDKLLFTNANNPYKWTANKAICYANCIYSTVNASNPIRIKTVCKYIYGGCKWIQKQKLNGAASLNQNIEPIVKSDGKPNESLAPPPLPPLKTIQSVSDPKVDPNKPSQPLDTNLPLSPLSLNAQLGGDTEQKNAPPKSSTTTKVSNSVGNSQPEAQIPPKMVENVTPTNKTVQSTPIGKSVGQNVPSNVNPIDNSQTNYENDDLDKEENDKDEVNKNDLTKDDPMVDKDDNFQQDPKTDDDGAKQGEDDGKYTN